MLTDKTKGILKCQKEDLTFIIALQPMILDEEIAPTNEFIY